MNVTWEDSIILSGTKSDFRLLKPAREHIQPGGGRKFEKLTLPQDLSPYLSADAAPLPTTEDREGYHGDRHYEYWLSGLSDYIKITDVVKRTSGQQKRDRRVLDFGCASGRVLRHFGAHSKYETWGCDISEDHVRWCNQFLPNVRVFQNTSLPSLPVSDHFFDVVYAMSVFTHIEKFETSWLCELYRILKPGGIVYATIHDEYSWNTMPLDWGAGHAVTQHPEFKKSWLKKGFPGEKFVSRWHNDRSYSSNVFYKKEYLEKTWGRFFDIIEFIPNASEYQTAIVMKKTNSAHT